MLALIPNICSCKPLSFFFTLRNTAEQYCYIFVWFSELCQNIKICGDLNNLGSHKVSKPSKFVGL